jgi:alginate O-acetyltransferase complex protein AlgJ
VESSGRQFVLVVAPDKSTMAPEHLPANFVGKACWQQATNAFWARIDSQPDMLDVRPALRAAAAQSGQSLYDQIDTHWSYQGGVVLTYALADKIEPGTTDGWVTLPTTQATWPADIPPLLGEQGNRHMLKYRLEPDGYTDRTNYVGSDFRTPLQLVEPPGTPTLPGQVTTPVGMIADSFAEFASPFLAAAFTNLTIVHPDTVADDPPAEARTQLADKRVIVLELAEREVAGGDSPILRPSVISAIGAALEAAPMH